MISESEWDTVINFGRYWASKYLRKFPNWSFDEIVNEVVIGYANIRHRYDAEKGSLNTFLKASIWDQVFRSYCRQRDIVISRPGQLRGGPTVQRVYTPMTTRLSDKYDVPMKEHQSDDVRLPAIPIDFHDLAGLLARGLTQRQAGYAMGLCESRISQRVKQLRAELS